MSSCKKLINNSDDVVTEMIEGLVETYPNLQYLDGFPEVKVVLRADISRSTYDKVAIISGGGSGHEPTHAGFVGVGMLTAAVCGDVFASPTVSAILSMVIVGDDCALPPPRGVSGRRGLAGTLFVHKVAGAAAATGLSLAEVAGEARRVANLVGTMGAALSVCTVPGQVTSDRLGPGKMELGLGIHGEPGAAVVDVQPVDAVVSHLLDRILSLETQYVPIKRGSRAALLVNGLGATPLMELMIASGKAVAQLQLDHGLAVERVYVGSLMTSLDMAGFSLSVLKVDDSILKRLDAPTNAPAWPVGVDGPRPSTTIPVSLPPVPSSLQKVPSRPKELTLSAQALEAAIHSGAEAVLKLKDALNEWDSKVGDGDCGSTMSKGATAVLEDMKKYYPLNDTAATVNEIGVSIRRVMGGTSGVIYDIFCKAAFVQMKECSSTTVSAKQWAEALDAAIVAVSKYGGASAGFRTLLDALIPASTTLQEKLMAGEDGIAAFLAASEAALVGAESTKMMQAQAGRSSYVTAEILATVPDPGAMAAASWFREAALTVARFHKVL